MSIDYIFHIFVSTTRIILNIAYTYSDSIIAIANIILIVFVFTQLRDSRKPLLFTKYIHENKEPKDRQNILEDNPYYFTVINKSKNLAKNIEIKYNFKSKECNLSGTEKISYLGPEEATRILLSCGCLIKEYPELFDEKKEGDRYNTIPKKNLKLKLDFEIKYNPVFASLFCYKTKDSYEIVWGSMESYPRFKDHPRISCWNKRDGKYYIDKLEGESIQITKPLKDDW
ncbi:MAG: hypothetical protein KAI26_05265 [Nanoarchaeota archaeon]|nr:hypothetical protein [Nanoarchaeota archaeon]